jgi:hypothetical protein
MVASGMASACARLRLPGCGETGGAFPPSLRVGGLAATLLMLLFALSGITACADSAPPAAARPPAAPEPVSPSGFTAIPFSFTWKSVPGHPIYRVRVTDAAERVLYERDVRVTQCWPSSDLTSMMADHATFAWTVAVLSPDGAQVVARSAAVEFSLK